MSQLSRRRPPYQREIFVGREEIVADILNVADSIRTEQLSAEGLSQQGRVVVITGEVGLGKTWLLKHLTVIIQEIFPSFLVYNCDISKCRANLTTTTSLEVLFLLKTFEREFLSTHLKDHSSSSNITDVIVANTSKHIMQAVSKLLQQHPLVVTVDAVFEADWDFLESLEEYFLGPLAIEPRVLIILSGRGQIFPWKTLELRRMTHFIALDAFGETETIKQLTLQCGAWAKGARKIHARTSGNPYQNYLYANDISPGEALDLILEEISQNQPHEISKYLKSLCVLRSFDEDHIPPLLAAYENSADNGEILFPEALQILNELLKHNLVHWDSSIRGYVIDNMLRLLAQDSVEEEPGMLKRLHVAARELYDEWSKHYNEHWYVEYHYHDIQIDELSMNSESLTA